MEKEKFQISAVRSELKSWLHPITNHVVIHIDDWCSTTVDRGDGDEEDVEYGEATIMLDKKRAISLRDKLNEFIETMAE